ncbi:MAG: ABC transporter ATP-binding protein [Phycisphaerales bacterium]
MTAELIQDDEYRGRLDLGLWRRIAAHALPYRRQLMVLAIAGFTVAVIDAIFPLVTGVMIDEATTNGATRRLAYFGAGYAALVVVLSGSIWLFIVLAGQVATGVAHDLREKSFGRLQELSFSFFDTRPVGWLVTRLTSDCSKLSSLIPWFALDLVWGSSLVLGIIAGMFWLDWRLALVVMLIVPPLILVSAFFQTRLLSSSRLIRKTNSQMTASYNEAIMGVRTTKALVREPENLAEFQTLSSSMFGHSMRNALQSAVYLPLVITLGSVGVGLALWRGGLRLGGGLTLGELVAFMQYSALFYMPIQELARRFTELQSAQAAAERVQGLLDTEPEIKDSDEVSRATVERDHSLAEPIRRIEFRGVDFWYKEGEPVLDDFNFTVESGQTVALVGATGGGKSTIVSLVARFYEPKRGEIRINGVEYRDRPLHWLQSNLGVVLQTPHLFSGTIRENIRYGRLEATNAEIEEAARVANAHAFIEEMDDGYESEVGEGGARLSTGQRQLVALARAILADPQIFIMDEATSSVDTETERLIQRGVERALEGRIAFVIAHRLSTIRSADVILVIDGGRIVEQGSHAELLRQGGRYHQLYTRHFAEEREASILAGA